MQAKLFTLKPQLCPLDRVLETERGDGARWEGACCQNAVLKAALLQGTFAN